MDKIEGLLQKIKENRWLDNHGKLSEDIKLFETRGDAMYAVLHIKDYTEKTDSLAKAAWDAAIVDDTNIDALIQARKDTRYAIFSLSTSDAWESATDMALYVRSLISLPKDSPFFHHAKKRADIWFAGYGVLCDVDGMIYAYKGRE